MPEVQYGNSIGTSPTIAILCYSCLASPLLNFNASDTQGVAPEQINYEGYYQIVDTDYSDVISKVEVIHKFSSYFLENVKDLDPEFSKMVDENFWDLI